MSDRWFHHLPVYFTQIRCVELTGKKAASVGKLQSLGGSAEVLVRWLWWETTKAGGLGKYKRGNGWPFFAMVLDLACTQALAPPTHCDFQALQDER